MSLQSFLASFGVPVDDVRVQSGLEFLVGVEPASGVVLVLEVAEHLLGRRVVDAVALAAHGLADAQFLEPVAPPLVLVLPSHVRVQDRGRVPGQACLEHGEQPLLLGEVGVPAYVPGDDLLGSHIVYGREVRLASGDLELGDVRAHLRVGSVRREVAFQQVRHLHARFSLVGAVFPVWVRASYPAFQTHAAHDPQHALMAHPHAELVHEAHAYLPVPAPVRGAMEDLGDQRLDVGPGNRRRMRQVMIVRASCQSGRPQQVDEPVSEPRQRRDDHRPLPVGDFDASRARAFSKYATLARKYAFSSSRSRSRVGSGFGLDFAPLGLPFGFGRNASGPPVR